MPPRARSRPASRQLGAFTWQPSIDAQSRRCRSCDSAAQPAWRVLLQMAVAHLQGSQLEQHASPALTRFELTVNRRSIPAYAARARRRMAVCLPCGAAGELARTDVDGGEAERQAVVAGGMRCRSGFSRAYQTRTSRPALGCLHVPRAIELPCKSGTLGNGREGSSSLSRRKPGFESR